MIHRKIAGHCLPSRHITDHYRSETDAGMIIHFHFTGDSRIRTNPNVVTYFGGTANTRTSGDQIPLPYFDPVSNMYQTLDLRIVTDNRVIPRKQGTGNVTVILDFDIFPDPKPAPSGPG